MFQISQYRREQGEIRKQQEEEKRLQLEELQKQLAEQAIIDQERYCTIKQRVIRFTKYNIISIGVTSIYYRPQTKFAKGGGRVWLLRGVCPVAPGGGHAWLLRGGCVWLLGGVHGCSWVACMVAPWGACMVAPGGGVWLLPGGHAWLLWGGVHAWLLPGGACMGYDEIQRYDQ